MNRVKIIRTKKYFLYLTALLLKPFPFVHGMLPFVLRETLRSWDAEMLWMWVKTFGKHRYIDRRCFLPDPPTFAPKAQIKGDNALSEEDIKFFYTNGYLGPFTLCSPKEMDELRPHIESILSEPSKTYGFQTERDRHLDNPYVVELVNKPAIVDRLAQLLGPDLQVWRSQVFNKPAGAGTEFTWHQASCYLSELGYKGTLEPKNKDELFQITTWIAIDNATAENGCMQVLPGTHRSMQTIGPGTGGFALANFKLDYEIDEDKVVTLECKPGQFIMFTERVIHGSKPNFTNTRRLGIAFRTIVPSVQVYRGETYHTVEYQKGLRYDLSNWGCVQLRGEDRFHLNKIVPLGYQIETEEEEEKIRHANIA